MERGLLFSSDVSRPADRVNTGQSRKPFSFTPWSHFSMKNTRIGNKECGNVPRKSTIGSTGCRGKRRCSTRLFIGRAMSEVNLNFTIIKKLAKCLKKKRLIERSVLARLLVKSLNVSTTRLRPGGEFSFRS